MAAEQTLFRPEALQAQGQQWLGPVRLVRPPALTWLTAGVLCAALAGATFITVAQYTRKATVGGVLVPDRGLIRLVPASAGTVIERHVVEGQQVQAGDVLFVLALDRTLLAADAQSQVRRSLDDRRRSLGDATRAQRQLMQTRRAALDRRLSALQSELAQLDIESQLQRQRLALGEQSMARLQALQADNFISSAQTQSKAEELLAVRAAAQGLSRQRAALQREQAEIEGERASLPLLTDSAVSGLERDLAQANRDAAEQDADQRLVLRAPQSGTVSSVLAVVGQSVSNSAALATLVPAGAQMQAQLYAPSSAIGFVQPGQPVRLRYEAFPYQKFGQQSAHVISVSRVPLAASEMAALSLSAAMPSTSEPMFRITVALDQTSSSLPLAAGMRLQADVVLERRRLVEWLFEPLLGWRSRF